MNRVLVSAIAIFATSLNACHADTVVLEAISDTTIYQDNFFNSNGAGDFFFAGNNGNNTSRRSLIRFDISSIPSGAIVTNVTFTAFMSQGNTQTVDVTMHRLANDWGESTSDAPGSEGGGAPAETGDATWLQNFFGTSDWANLGGDFESNASATASIGANNQNYSWESIGLVNDVQSWLEGSSSNFGWVLVGDESQAATAKRFNSRTSASNNPFLTVEFTTIPEPGVAVILLVAVLGSTIRHRVN